MEPILVVIGIVLVMCALLWTKKEIK